MGNEGQVLENKSREVVSFSCFFVPAHNEGFVVRQFFILDLIVGIAAGAIILDDTNGPRPGVAGNLSNEEIGDLAVRGVIVKISHLFATVNLHEVSPTVVASHLVASLRIDCLYRQTG